MLEFLVFYWRRNSNPCFHIAARFASESTTCGALSNEYREGTEIPRRLLFRTHEAQWGHLLLCVDRGTAVRRLGRV